MTPPLIIVLIVLYFGVLYLIARLTSRKADNNAFFIGNHSSPWFLVAFGMIGASLSGITFISIPGWVQDSQFGYMQMVFGYVIGYIIIAFVLMPIYYKSNLTSIYTYLQKRFGFWSYKTGVFYFLISRITGASIRLLLVANVLQYLVFNQLHVPFEVTVMASILLIWLYTAKGGIKTIIYTDTLQTLFMLVSLVVTIYLLIKNIDFGEEGVVSGVVNSRFSQIFFFDDFFEGSHFVKQFFGGMFIAIGMTGLDQDMMQKNLSCRSLKDAQKNMMTFTVVLVVVNLLFLVLGALLYMYAEKTGIAVPEVNGVVRTDLLFAKTATDGGLGIGVAILFLLGLIAAAYSSADSALTSLTTCVSVDVLDLYKRPTEKQEIIRKRVHVVMSAVLFIVILFLNKFLDRSAIFQLIFLAGFTYGPLIGLFFFGLLSTRSLRDRFVPIICVIAPIITVIVRYNSFYNPNLQNPKDCLFGAYTFGPELIVVNAVISFVLLWMISCKVSPRC